MIGKLCQFPGLQQIGCLRKQIYSNGRLILEEYRYHVTSANRRKLPPKRFLQAIRGHWQIENSLHHVKDRSWQEDKMYSKRSEQGWILGKLRNQALNVIRILARKLGWKEESMPKWTAQLLSTPKRTLVLMQGL